MWLPTGTRKWNIAFGKEEKTGSKSSWTAGWKAWETSKGQWKGWNSVWTSRTKSAKSSPSLTNYDILFSILWFISILGNQSIQWVFIHKTNPFTQATHLISNLLLLYSFLLSNSWSSCFILFSSNHLNFQKDVPLEILLPVDIHVDVVVQIAKDASVDQRRNEQGHGRSKPVVNLDVERLRTNRHDEEQVELE